MAISNFNKSCKICIYFADENSIMGSCRRFPSYQNRHSTEWCGEFDQNPSLVALDNLVADVTRATIMAEVGAIKPKLGRPKKNVA
jgi:hypothetical protein